MASSLKTVAYSCPFVPAEWIAAHGLRPRQIVAAGSASGVVGAAGLCPYADAFAFTAASEETFDAVIVTTLCDQMRRVYERIARDAEKPAFLLNVPSTWQSVAACNYYVSELLRLGRFLEGLGGVLPSWERLAEVMQRYNSARESIRNSKEHLSLKAFSQALIRFNQTGEEIGNPSLSLCEERGIPVALVGGPLRERDFAIFDLVEQSGGGVVLDGTETGERALPDRFNLDNVQRDPIRELARAYFETIPDVSRRPNDGLYRWLQREIEQRGARGLIVLYYTWCDPWHAEIQRLKEYLRMPTIGINLDAAEEAGVSPRNATRIQTLLEVLR